MKFHQPQAQIFIPDNTPITDALARTTHLAIGAHQDDLEIMATDGIFACFQQPDKWFSGVVVTNGRGSPRSGIYGNYTDDEMWTVRNAEQKKAATIGEYGSQIFLDYPSTAVKNGDDTQPITDVAQILRATRPDIVYTHNLADKHDTHIGVALKTIAAIRQMPQLERPQKLYGCEVWRDLDWLSDDRKVIFNLSEFENLQMALVGVFDSQVSGGKRYDLATMGRRRANATYFASHATDDALGLNFAMDLTPLVEDDALDVGQFIESILLEFVTDVTQRLEKIRR